MLSFQFKETLMAHCFFKNIYINNDTCLIKNRYQERNYVATDEKWFYTLIPAVTAVGGAIIKHEPGAGS